MKYKAIVLDIDGTLIPHTREGRPSKGVKDVLKQARDTVHIGIATARSYPMVENIFAELDFQGIAILNSGARIMDISSHTVLRDKILSIKSLTEIISILESLAIPFVRETMGNDVLDISTFHIDPHLARMAMERMSSLSDVCAYQVNSWDKGKDMIHISHRDATKQHGVAEFARLARVSPEEIIGVGDGYNDFALLNACGLKVAMGNAVQELKDIADYIAPTVTDDGVVHVINKFILNTV